MLILASASPRRSELLTQAGYHFQIHPAHIPEDPHPNEDPIAYVTRLAREKAQAVYNQLSPTTPGITVLGADTTVTIDRPDPRQTRIARRRSPHPPHPERTHPPRHHRRLRRHRHPHANRRRSHRRPVPHHLRSRNPAIHRHRRTHGQSRSLRHPGPRRPLDPPHRRLLLQRRRPPHRTSLHPPRRRIDNFVATRSSTPGKRKLQPTHPSRYS